MFGNLFTKFVDNDGETNIKTRFALMFWYKKHENVRNNENLGYR